jgi:hypothetical protein
MVARRDLEDWKGEQLRVAHVDCSRRKLILCVSKRLYLVTRYMALGICPFYPSAERHVAQRWDGVRRRCLLDIRVHAAWTKLTELWVMMGRRYEETAKRPGKVTADDGRGVGRIDRKVWPRKKSCEKRQGKKERNEPTAEEIE